MQDRHPGLKIENKTPRRSLEGCRCDSVILDSWLLLHSLKSLRYPISNRHHSSTEPTITLKNNSLLARNFRRRAENKRLAQCRQCEGALASPAHQGGGPSRHLTIPPQQLYRVIYAPSRWQQRVSCVPVIVFSVKVSWDSFVLLIWRRYFSACDRRARLNGFVETTH